jgi:hypothetical protein
MILLLNYDIYYVELRYQQFENISSVHPKCDVTDTDQVFIFIERPYRKEDFQLPATGTAQQALKAIQR